MSTDKLTTIFGAAAALSQASAQFGVAPAITNPASAVFLALLGYFSNKPTRIK